MKFGGYLLVLRERNIVLHIFSSLSLSLSSAFFAWLLPITLYKFGSVSLVGIVYTIATVISIFLGPLAGLLADYYGRRAVIILARTFPVVAFGMLMLDLSTYTLSLAVVIIDISIVMSYPAIFSLIAESVEEGHRSYAYTIAALLPYVSAGIGSLVLGRLTEEGIRSAIMITFLLSLLALFMSFLFRETLVKRGGRGESHREFLNLTHLKELKSLGVIYIYIVIISIIGGFASSLFSIYMPIYLKSELSLFEKDVGLAYAVSSLTAATLLPIVGLVVAAIGGLRALQTSLILMAFPVITLGFLSTGALLAVIILLTISTSASTLSQVAGNVFIAGITSSLTRSTVIGSLMPFIQLTSSFAPLLGAITFSQNPRTIPILIGGLFLTSFALLSRLAKRLKANEISKKTSEFKRNFKK